jgi:NMD protein affecting ribosome stability and mRNA decay
MVEKKDIKIEKEKHKEETSKKRIRELICPKCGRSSRDVPFHGFLCIDDFLAEKKIEVPSKILFQVCRYGDKMNARNNPKAWVTEWSDIKKQIEGLVKAKGGQIRCTDVNLERNVAVVDIVFEGDEKNKIVKEIPLDVRHTLCDVHTKSTRGYYEAIIQIRPPERWKAETKEEEEEIEKLIERKTNKIISTLEYVQPDVYVKKVNLKKGVDLYVSSNRAAFQALSELGIKIVKSSKLWTMKEGKELYRITFIVRVGENLRKQEEKERED